MARVTVEDCLKKIDSRFVLVHLTTKRVAQLRAGAEPLLNSKNKEVVVALREIAAGKVTPQNINQLGKVEKKPSVEPKAEE